MVIWYAIPAPQQGTELVSVVVVITEYIMKPPSCPHPVYTWPGDGDESGIADAAGEGSGKMVTVSMLETSF